VALANLDVMEREDLPGRVQELEPELRSGLVRLTDLPIVAEVRGMGSFYGVELTKNGADFTDEECEWLIRGFLSQRLLELGLICRADDRGDPVIQLSPSLVSGPDEFDLIASTLHQVLLEAWKELDR
jgi:adenosylmethionine-8-amino-7-oxononanoate aminotransferase